MKYIELDGNEIEFLNHYMTLKNEKKRLIEYITRIGASEIFSDEEFVDFLELLKK